ncbi:MAG: hypothetical protein WBA12_12390, partial [Catalinimonas sp.]
MQQPAPGSYFYDVRNWWWLLLWGWASALSAQDSRWVRGTARETHSGRPLPFVIVAVNGGERFVLSDDAGRFALQANIGDRLQFRTPAHRPARWRLMPGDDDTLDVRLNRTALDDGVGKTLPAARRAIDRVVGQRAAHDPLRRPFSFEAYTRLRLTTNDVAATKR